MSPPPAAGAWLVRPVPRPHARTQLICLHAAGSGPAMFRGWAAAMPDDVEVVLVHLPGRESRIGEPAIAEYQTAVTALTDVLRAGLNRPWAMFGHSMGAWLAFGAAQSLVAAGTHPPCRLFASACAAPHLAGRSGRPAPRSDEELVAELRRLGGTHPEALREPALLRVVLPTMRADFLVCDTATPPAGGPLPAPITVLGGTEDEVTVEELTAWSRWSSAGTEVLRFPGGHFFLTGAAREPVLDVLRARLAGQA